MAVKLIYSDVPLGAAEDASVNVSEASAFSEPSALPFGVVTGAIATMEHNGWGLSSDYKVKDKQPFALWTDTMSNDSGAFETPPNITLDFTSQYTSTGLTIRFSPDAGEYCRKLTVIWYQGEEIKDSGDFYPTTGNFILENTVEAFDRIEIVFQETSLPQRRLKIEHIGIGVLREFTGRELTGTSFVHEVNLISDNLPINVMDANFHSSTDTEFIFQKKQPVEAYDGGALIGVYYIENGDRTGGRHYTIACQDAIGVLELDKYEGGIWFTDTPLEDILFDIVGDAFEFEIDPEYANTTLRGYIKPATKREALQRVSFSIGAIMDTAGTRKIKVFPTPLTGEKEIPTTETYTGGKVATSDIVTEVSVIGYDITDEEPGENEEYIEHNGKQYKCIPQTKTSRNPNITAGQLENKIEFAECYLVTSDKAQQIADTILAYYMRRNKYSATHILSGNKLADRVRISLPWGDMVSGNITKMSIKTSGITISDSEILLD